MKEIYTMYFEADAYQREMNRMCILESGTKLENAIRLSKEEIQKTFGSKRVISKGIQKTLRKYNTSNAGK